MLSSDERSLSKMRPFVRKAVLWSVLILLLLFLLWRLELREPLERLFQEVGKLGPWGPLAYIGLYIAACLLLLPGMVVGFAGGALFGVRHGFVYASVGCALGASAAFLVARHLVRHRVERWISHHRLYQACQDAVAEGGWRIVALARLSLLMPFSLLNYAFGISRVSLRGFFFATWLGMLPETALQVYAGALVRDVSLAGLRGQRRSLAEWALFGAGLLATAVLAVYAGRLAGRALRRKIHIVGAPVS
jgi:uncharacterized membrane protein YdjX (TVP38/TMEM64 family)